MYASSMTVLLDALITIVIGLQFINMRESRQIHDRLKRIEIYLGINGKPQLSRGRK